MTVTVFDRPQFALLPDFAGARVYGNVDNRLEVHAPSHNPGTWHVALAVPTGLFPLMKGALAVGPEESVSLSLDEAVEDPPRYILGLLAGESRLYDLWSYSAGSVPRWVFNPEYRLKG
jgi:hypothetical protein